MHRPRYAVKTLQHAERSEITIQIGDNLQEVTAFAESYHMKNSVIRTRVADMHRDGRTAVMSFGQGKDGEAIWGVKS